MFNPDPNPNPNPKLVTQRACVPNRVCHHLVQALVFGHPEQDTWVVDAPITVDETDEKGFKMRVAAVDEPAGKSSQTEVEVLTRGYYNLEGAFKGKPISKVLLRPLT